MARGERLSDLPESLLIHILSMLQNSKEVVRTSVLSTQWRSLWKSVPVSLKINVCGFSSKKDNVYLASRELYYWRSAEKIRTFRVSFLCYKKNYVNDVDMWVHFATKDANVEDFTLEFSTLFNPEKYEFPQFAFKNNLLRNLVIKNCILIPFGSVNWSNLVSLSIGCVELTDGAMEKVLSGCPNLECLEPSQIDGIYRLEISNVKLRELIIEEYKNDDHVLWLEILAQHIQKLQLLGCCSEIRINVASLVTAVICLDFDFEDEENKLEKECSYMKELLHSIAHVEKLELGPWCIEYLSILELKGWQSPPSSWKFLKLNAAMVPLDFPGICSFLQSSSDLETLVIEWDNHEQRDLLSGYTDEDEQSRRFEAHNFNCSLLHLKTIKFINFAGPLSENEFVLPLLTYLLKNATVLEKFVITAGFKRSESPQDYVQMEQEFLSFPRSSRHASFVLIFYR